MRPFTAWASRETLEHEKSNWNCCPESRLPDAARCNPRRAVEPRCSRLVAAALTTADNPQAPPVEDTGVAPYAGPAPRDADVQNFKVEFWEKTRSTDRCGSCHNESFGQPPMFVAHRRRQSRLRRGRGEDRPRPAFACREFVSKVSAPPIGHNCWVDDPETCGEIVTNWIEKWVG